MKKPRKPSEETIKGDYAKHQGYMKKWSEERGVLWPFQYTENAIEYFKHRSESGDKYSTVNLARSALRDHEIRTGRYCSVIDYLRLCEAINDMQFEDNGETKHLTVEPFTKIIEKLSMQADYMSYITMVIMLIMANTKLRRMAVSEIEETDIQRTDKGIAIDHNGIEWSIPYRNNVLCLSDALDALHAKKPFQSKWVFLKKKPRGADYFDEQIGDRTVNNKIKKEIVAFGLMGYSSDSISGILI